MAKIGFQAVISNHVGTDNLSQDQRATTIAIPYSFPQQLHIAATQVLGTGKGLLALIFSSGDGNELFCRKAFHGTSKQELAAIRGRDSRVLTFLSSVAKIQTLPRSQSTSTWSPSEKAAAELRKRKCRARVSAELTSLTSFVPVNCQSLTNWLGDQFRRPVTALLLLQFRSLDLILPQGRTDPSAWSGSLLFCRSSGRTNTPPLLQLGIVHPTQSLILQLTIQPSRSQPPRRLQLLNRTKRI